MTTSAPNVPLAYVHTPDERTMAALAHGSAVLNFFTGFGGPIAALIIWLTQKDKSPWVAFQALQSLVFQAAVMFIAVLAVGVVWVIGFIISFATIGFGAIVAVPFMILVFFGGFVIVGAGVFYCLYAAYQIYQDKDFRYLWVGDWLQRRSTPH
jgi:uncharacterized Tic20 family protein